MSRISNQCYSTQSPYLTLTRPLTKETSINSMCERYPMNRNVNFQSLSSADRTSPLTGQHTQKRNDFLYIRSYNSHERNIYNHEPKIEFHA